MNYKFEEYNHTINENLINTFEDKNLFQTTSWIKFLTKTQKIKPLCIAVFDSGKQIGIFYGLTISKFGIKILGSPLAGWTTPYLGLNLQKDYPRGGVIKELCNFLIEKMGYHHIEIVDKNLTIEECKNFNINYLTIKGLGISLMDDEKQLFTRMSYSSCRNPINQSKNRGVFFEICKDVDFAYEYMEQLKDVFARQKLLPTYSVERVLQLIVNLQETGNLLLLRAFNPEKKCIATGIFPAFNKIAYFWGGASLRKYCYYRPNEAIIWEAMKYWKSKGIQYFDMMGYAKYKEKYGSIPYYVPRIIVSKRKTLIVLRNFYKHLYKMKQKVFYYLK